MVLDTKGTSFTSSSLIGNGKKEAKEVSEFLELICLTSSQSGSCVVSQVR
jgi:hypothetical protein